MFWCQRICLCNKILTSVIKWLVKQKGHFCQKPCLKKNFSKGQLGPGSRDKKPQPLQKFAGLDTRAVFVSPFSHILLQNHYFYYYYTGDLNTPFHYWKHLNTELQIVWYLNRWFMCYALSTWTTIWLPNQCIENKMASNCLVIQMVGLLLKFWNPSLCWSISFFSCSLLHKWRHKSTEN